MADRAARTCFPLGGVGAAGHARGPPPHTTIAHAGEQANAALPTDPLGGVGGFARFRSEEIRDVGTSTANWLRDDGLFTAPRGNALSIPLPPPGPSSTTTMVPKLTSSDALDIISALDKMCTMAKDSKVVQQNEVHGIKVKAVPRVDKKYTCLHARSRACAFQLFCGF